MTISTGRKTRALVVGGGIAGTCAALALQKAGLSPVILESHGASSDGVGAFLTVAVNGLAALRLLDVDLASAGGFATPRMVLQLGDGERLGELGAGRDPTTGLVTQTIARADLYAALRDEVTRRGIPITYGKRLVSADRTREGVVARFADGSDEEGALLVGADGLRSRVREIVDPKAPPARYVGLLNTGGYARGVDVPGDVGTMYMIFGKRCFFGYVKHPGGDVWWFANPARKREPTREELAAMGSEGWRAELVELFSVDASPAAALVQATPEILAGWATYDMPRVPRWHRDRMIVIGDAAHAASPSSGQGASMAMEDAVVLAKCLRDASSIEDAFAGYERARRDRVERVVAMGKRGGSGKTPGTLGRVVRDLALRWVFARMMKRREDPMAWVFEAPLTWEATA
jgi:FAD-dependent urate hydroxylase